MFFAYAYSVIFYSYFDGRCNFFQRYGYFFIVSGIFYRVVQQDTQLLANHNLISRQFNIAGLAF